MIDRVKQLRRMTLMLIAVASFLTLFLNANVASALSSEGPIHLDNDGTPLIRESNAYGNSFPGRGRYWDYVVSNDDYTDIWSSDVLVYSPIQNPTITIIGSDLCINNSAGMRAGDVPYSPFQPNGRRANDFRIYTFNPTLGPAFGSGIPVAYDSGNWNYSAAATCRASQVVLTPAAFSAIDPGTGMYIYRVNALANRATGGKFANSFHVVGPTGSIVTQSAVPAFSGFGMQATYPVPDAPAPNDPTPPDPFRVYTDLDIPFGPDCTLTTATATKRVMVSDADNQGQFSVQPRPFSVSVLAFTQSTGVYRGPVVLTPAGNVNGGAIDVSGNGTVWQPTGGNQTGVGFDFTVQRGVVYRFRISNVYYNNTLQFRLPYDGAHYYLPCVQPTTVRPVVSITPNPAENGETLTATAFAQQTTASGINSRVNYGRLIWSDTDRDGVYDTGERVFGGTPDSGTVDVPPTPGRYNFPTWSEVADTGIHGGRVCIRLSIAASPPVSIQSNPAVQCTDIGKKPKLQVATGDVFVGGTFRDGSGTCAQQTVTATTLRLQGSITTIGGATYGSYADYGAFNLGETTNFGANGFPPGAAALNLTFGNDPAPLGYFYSNNTPVRSDPTRARCLNDPFAFFGPKATPDSAATSIDPSAGSVSLTTNGVVNISGALLTPGYRAVIYAKNASEVIINGNITYAEGPYTSIDQIPQLVILSKGRLTIREGVNRLDGIYATQGDLLTCDIAPTLTQCNQQLVVNGAVIVGGQVAPFRTFGAQKPNYADKAEIFRLRPDVLLNQVLAPGEPTNIRTINQREVPPRF